MRPARNFLRPLNIFKEPIEGYIYQCFEVLAGEYGLRSNFYLFMRPFHAVLTFVSMRPFHAARYRKSLATPDLDYQIF